MRNTSGVKRKIELRRQNILEVGYKLYSENSIDAVSMQRIADASGISFATMYRYFESKLALVVEIGALKWGEFARENAAWMDEAGAASMTAAEQFGRYLDRYIDLYRERQDLLRFNQYFNVFVSHEECDPAVLKPYLEIIDGVAARFHSIYEKAKADGTLRTDIPEQEMFAGTLHIMLAAATRYAVGLVYQPEGSDPERELLQLRDMMLREYVITK